MRISEDAIWPHIVFPIALVAVLITAGMALAMIWAPLGYAPVTAFLIFGVWYNFLRCVCGHRYYSHMRFFGCTKCARGWNPQVTVLPTGLTQSNYGHWCTTPRRAA